MAENKAGLKRGNVKNVGRKPDWLREELRKGIQSAFPAIIKIAEGSTSRKFERVSSGGSIKTIVDRPTFDEQIKAFDMLCRYGLGVVKETIDPDGTKRTERQIFTFD